MFWPWVYPVIFARFPEILEAVSRLAVSYNINVIAGWDFSQYWAEVGVEGIVKTWDRPLFQQKRQDDECELCSHGDPGRGASWTVGLMVDARMDAPASSPINIDL